MNIGKTLFAQLMDFLPWSTFTRIVTRYGGDQRVRTLSCAEHYRAMAFAQLTYRESLRDIETCLSAQASKLYAMGFRDPVRRSITPLAGPSVPADVFDAATTPAEWSPGVASEGTVTLNLMSTRFPGSTVYWLAPSVTHVPTSLAFSSSRRRLKEPSVATSLM